MSPRAACPRQRASRSLGFEQLEDRRVLSGASLLSAVPLSLPVPLAAALSAEISPTGVTASTTVQTSGSSATTDVTSSPTTSTSSTTASLTVQTPLLSVSASVSLSDGTSGGGGGSTGSSGGGTGGGGSLLGSSSGSGSLTVGAGSLGSAGGFVGLTSFGSGGQGMPGTDPGVNSSGGQGSGMGLPPSFFATQPGIGNSAAQLAAGSDPAPFLVPALLDSTSGPGQSAQAIALVREEAAQAVPSLLATVPGQSLASFAGDAGLDSALGEALAAAGNGPARMALRAGSYNLDAQEEEAVLPAEEQLPDEASDAGLMVVPADGSGLDQSLQQLLDELNSLGQGLNQALPGGLAFWVLAGAVGVTACVTVRRRQAARAVLAGDALAWIPSLTGFLPSDAS